MKERRIVILAIKPKHAEKIYAGEKRWEFRKVPPPVPGFVYLYESAPVSAVTGMVYLAAKIQGEPECVWGFAKTQKTIGGGPGITFREFQAYVGKAKSVTACATFYAERFPVPIPLQGGVRPPQNYGRYRLVEKDVAAKTEAPE
jgi:predicted transcriptional regulator